MNNRDLFKNISGNLSGTKKLWMAPGQDAQESPSTVKVTPIARDRFLEISYKWTTEDTNQEGKIILPAEIAETETNAVWLDSWHTPSSMMVCDLIEKGDTLVLNGSYAAPPGPDWGWRIEIDSEGKSSLEIRMYNITPDGDELLGVHAKYGSAD